MKARRDREKPFCACMVSRSEWYKSSAAGAKSLATAVFENLRTCPFCLMRGRGQWGQILPVDRKAAKLPRPRRPSRMRIFLVAVRVAFASFVDTMKLAESAEM